jgi:malonate decarboxylase alpha subunit
VGLLPREKLVEALIVPGDRIVIEGDNQKQADLLSRSLASTDPKKLHDLHLIISSISRPEHLTLFELGIVKKIDFAYSSQSLRLAQLLEDGLLEIGAIHGVQFSPTVAFGGGRMYITEAARGP